MLSILLVVHKMETVSKFSQFVLECLDHLGGDEEMVFVEVCHDETFPELPWFVDLDDQFFDGWVTFNKETKLHLNHLNSLKKISIKTHYNQLSSHHQFVATSKYLPVKSYHHFMNIFNFLAKKQFPLFQTFFWSLPYFTLINNRQLSKIF